MPGDLVVYGVSRETACMCRRTGGNSEEGTPVPIPNTVVKLFSSDDTLGAAPRENKTSPFHPPTWAVFFVAFWEWVAPVLRSAGSTLIVKIPDIPLFLLFF